MASKLKASEKKISRDIDSCLMQNDLDEMLDIEIVDEYIQELTSSHRKFVDIHDDLHDALCTDEHRKLYPKYSEILDRLNSEIKKAKSAKYRLRRENEERLRKEQEAREIAREDRLRKERKEELLRQEEREGRLRKEKEEKEERLRKYQEEKEERLRKEQKAELEEKARRELESREMKVRDEIGLCLCKIQTVLTSFPISKIGLVEDIRLNISKISDYLGTYNYLSNKLASIIGKVDKSFDDNIGRAEDYILSGNEKIEFILQETDRSKFEERRSEKEELAMRKEHEENIRREKEELLSQRLLAEIYAKETSLSDIQWISVTQLEDRDLLNYEKDINSLDTKFSSLTERVTNLISQLPIEFKNRAEVIGERSKKEKEIKGILDSFKQELRAEIANRNISEESLLNTPNLKIKLEKFSGYNSAIDIYTFQTEFEKLFLRSVERKLLPDYLKNNYLEGSALNLVRSIEDLDKIWKRLKESFGDTEILLRNKLKEIEKMGPIWKTRDRQKLVQVLSRLSYTMNELKCLAIKHDIENELYYGGGLQKVFEVIGYSYRDKYVRNYAKFKLSKVETWDKLIEFIGVEVEIQEQINLLDKSLRNDRDKTRIPEIEGKKLSYTSSTKVIACVLCEKKDHSVTTDHFGRPVVQ